MVNDNSKAVAAQWELRRFAKGKPPHVRRAARTAILYLTHIARGYAGPKTYVALAEKFEILKGAR